LEISATRGSALRGVPWFLYSDKGFFDRVSWSHCELDWLFWFGNSIKPPIVSNDPFLCTINGLTWEIDIKIRIRPKKAKKKKCWFANNAAYESWILRLNFTLLERLRDLLLGFGEFWFGLHKYFLTVKSQPSAKQDTFLQPIFKRIKFCVYKRLTMTADNDYKYNGSFELAACTEDIVIESIKIL